MKFRAGAVLLISAAFASFANAQNPSGPLNFSSVVERTPYLSFSNPSALSSFDTCRIAVAEVSAGKENGEVVSLSESSDSFSAGAYTESYGKMTGRLSYYGKLAYSYFQGNNMGGQILMDPLHSPVNFLESTLETAGTRKKELYTLVGALSYKLSDAWAAGFRVDYEAGDYTKIKDPRFSNIWMDLGITAGVTLKPSKDFSLGLSLRWRNTLEQIKGSIFGTTDKQYFIFTDRGGFFGTVSELDGDYNALPASSYRPMSNTYLCGSVDAVFGGRFFNQLSAYYRSGYYGKKSSSTATFFENKGLVASYDAVLLVPRGENLHRIFLNSTFEMMDNYENSFKYVTPVGQQTVVEYISQSKVLDRCDVSAALGYKWSRNVDGYCPDLEIGATLDFFSRFQTTTVYPVYRKHNYCNAGAEIFGARSFSSGKNIFSLRLALTFLGGFGTPAQDGTYSQGASSSFKSYDECLNLQFEYDTAMRAGACLGFTYTRLVSEKLALYASVSDRFAMLLTQPQYLGGRTRNCAVIAVGCNF